MFDVLSVILVVGILVVYLYGLFGIVYTITRKVFRKGRKNGKKAPLGSAEGPTLPGV